MKCLLCDSTETKTLSKQGDPRRFVCCANCDLIFLDPKLRLTPEQEKERYLQHNNDIQDIGYQNFVTPLVDLVRNQIPANSQGLDFGSGTGPVLSYLLEQAGFQVGQYDAYFAPDKKFLENQYDFIVSCEVVEHLYDPLTEFRRLYSILKPGGLLGIMTLLYQGEDLFNWYYSKDPTHVVFFSEKNLNWLAIQLGFKSVTLHSARLISFRR